MINVMSALGHKRTFAVQNAMSALCQWWTFLVWLLIGHSSTKEHDPGIRV